MVVYTVELTLFLLLNIFALRSLLREYNYTLKSSSFTRYNADEGAYDRRLKIEYNRKYRLVSYIKGIFILV